MKTAIDYTDRVYNVLMEAAFEDNLDGLIYTETDIPEPGKEFVLITSPGVGHDFDVVDKADVTVNLIIADDNGISNRRRFRFLLKILNSILENYTPHKNAFNQYEKDNDGAKVTTSVAAANEYFHINPVFSDGIHHDPERQGYSYYSIRTSCWIEK